MLKEQNVTALYREFASADHVRTALQNEGIAIARIHVVPDRVAGIDDAADFGLYDSIIGELDLPEADAETYKEAVRRGDYVVSVTVDEADVPRVEEVMRHPEFVTDRVEPPARREELTPEEQERRLDTIPPMGF